MFLILVAQVHYTYAKIKGFAKLKKGCFSNLVLWKKERWWIFLTFPRQENFRNYWLWRGNRSNKVYTTLFFCRIVKIFIFFSTCHIIKNNITLIKIFSIYPFNNNVDLSLNSRNVINKINEGSLYIPDRGLLGINNSSHLVPDNGMEN